MNINTIHLHTGDTIIININRLDWESQREIYNNMKEKFPNNEVLIMDESIFKGITIINKDKTSYNMFLKDYDSFT